MRPASWKRKENRVVMNRKAKATGAVVPPWVPSTLSPSVEILGRFHLGHWFDIVVLGRVPCRTDIGVSSPAARHRTTFARGILDIAGRFLVTVRFARDSLAGRVEGQCRGHRMPSLLRDGSRWIDSHDRISV